MREVLGAMGAVAAGGCCAAAVLAAGFWRGGPVSVTPLLRRRAAFTAVRLIAYARRWLTDAIERASWRESAERVAIFALALGGCLGVIGAGTATAMPKGAAVVLGLLGFCFGCALPLLALSSAIARRRRRLSAELVPILELFTLELSAGGSALSALGSVTVQVEGELAADLRRMLIASQVAGSPSFESRLLEYSDRFEMPALSSLATILAASREYGTGASQGVRALATDLRRAQRRELIARSRHALNSVLLPAAVGVLLPFLGVLMFPAVSVLQRNLR
jgi:Flp pilus assembly protein TadB